MLSGRSGRRTPIIASIGCQVPADDLRAKSLKQKAIRVIAILHLPVSKYLSRS